MRLDITSFYEKHFGIINLLMAIGMAGVFALADIFTGFGGAVASFLGENHVALFSVLASVYGSLLGFTITTVSILIGFANAKRLTILRSSKHHKTLWKIFTSSIWWLAFATTSSIVTLMLNPASIVGKLAIYLAVFVLFAVTLLIGRCIWVLENIVKMIMSQDSSDPAPDDDA